MMYKRCMVLLVILFTLIVLNVGSFLFVQPGVASAHSQGTSAVSDDCVSLNCPDNGTPSLPQ